MTAVRFLDLLDALLGDARRVLGGLCRRAKFGWNRCSSFDSIKSFNILLV